jgi:TrmH family RNA methyltransferase
VIYSLQNQFIKDLVKLHKTSERKKTGTCLVEGVREVSILQEYKHDINTLILCKDIYEEDIHYKIDLSDESKIVEVSKEVYNKLSYREGTEGICALISTKKKDLSNLSLSEQSTILILESLEKPGNIGAILRTADAAGVDAVILANPLCDPYNPNVIRSSLGCVFAMQVFSASTDETIQFLNANGFDTYSASLQTDKNFYNIHFKGRTALVFGSEANGLTETWYNQSNPVKIPMRGKIDSLNVGASAAIMLFEVVRQKLGNE